MSWNSVVVRDESIFEDHHRVTKTTKVSAIMHFLCKDVGGVDNTWDVDNLGDLVLVAFPNLVFSGIIHVLNSFTCDGCINLSVCFIVVVNCGAIRCFVYSNVLGTVFDRL